MENKPILIFYVGVKDCSGYREMEQMLSLIIENMEPKAHSNNLIHYYIPVMERSTRIECVNPIVIGGEEYKKIQKQLEETQEKLKNIVLENEKETN